MTFNNNPHSRIVVRLGLDSASQRTATYERRSGFTLVEVMISLTIFALLAAGLMYSALHVRFSAEAAVRESIAVAIATGFLEQMSAAEFQNLSNRIINRNSDFQFVSRDGQPLDPTRGLETMAQTAWGSPITVPLVDTRDDDGNIVDGPAMDFWFIPAVDFSVDAPVDCIDIRIRFRWDNGRSLRTGNYPERTLVMMRTRIST